TMISVQRSIHSSQMNTDGPAISLRTSCWLLLQNEQCSALSSVDPFFSGIKLFVKFSGQNDIACRLISRELRSVHRPAVSIRPRRRERPGLYLPNHTIPHLQPT